MDIRQLLNSGILIFDGAMGTMLQKYGLPTGQLPELFNFTHPEILKDIYHQYLSAGSQIISTNTFGANRLKVEGSGYTVEQIITEAVGLAREAVDEYQSNYDRSDQGRFNQDKSDQEMSHFDRSNGKRYVALSLGPVGKLMEPAGDLGFEEACDLYREQIRAGIKAGADLILIETQSDLYELKAAVITARELTDLPLFCTVTFQENGRMLMGADPLTAVTTLQDLGIDALGVNCSLGPHQMIPIVEEILKYSRLPVMVQPNAGLPEMAEGQTIYNVGVKAYGDAMEQMLRAGVSVVGGCCGTTPEYIEELKNRVKLIGDETMFGNLAAHHPCTAVSSATKTVVLDQRVRVIGERINPTGKKLLREALTTGDYNYIENEAILQVKAGAEVLDINVGLPGIDEEAAMCEAVRRVSAVTDAPLQIDSSDPRVIEAAVRLYNGRPIINSVNGKQEVMDAIFPIVKKYGTCVIALTLDEKGLPKNAEERVAIAERIIREAEKYGIGRERILVDCLTLTVSAKQDAGRDTLEAIRRVKARFGVKTTLGASNVSFGLPERKLLNRTFLAMALEAGLDAPITDPLVGEYMDTIYAFETLACKDADSRDYIARFGGMAENIAEDVKVKKAKRAAGIIPEKNEGSTLSEDDVLEHALTEIILSGYQDRSAKATRELLKYRKPLQIVETVIIPALEIVGQEYETGEKFLPQLIQSADAVKFAFDVLKQEMAAGGETISYGRIILATVKGDIHDIGKNIVKVLLENYGYEVVDLGKDTDINLIVDTAKRERIELVGLSALMTTTVVNMEATIKALREAGLRCKVAVGGAVLNAEYAAAIGADYYCKDAMDTVRAANSIFKG